MLHSVNLNLNNMRVKNNKQTTESGDLKSYEEIYSHHKPFAPHFWCEQCKPTLYVHCTLTIE